MVNDHIHLSYSKELRLLERAKIIDIYELSKLPIVHEVPRATFQIGFS